MTFLDRIKETSTSTGTGTFTLSGAVTGYKVFSNGTYKYCIVNASETEWEVGEGTVASGVLTRTTIEASSNGGAAVSFSAGTKYVFNTVSAAYVNSLVPYTGATASVNLGAYNITATNIIRAGGLATDFLKADGSVDSTTYMNRAVYDTDGNGVVDAAEKMQTIGRNATGATLYKGTIVYISGSTGNRPNFVKAQANSEATSAGTFGVVVSDIANNSDGYVATIGTLSDLDTRTTATNPFTSVTLADGDTIYLDPNTAGYITNVKPSAPNHIVYIGKVVRTSPTLGTIVYRIQNGYELNEIHDVAISSVANNDVLVYESSTTLWKNKSIATILGYTPQAVITLTTTGTSGAATFASNTLNIPQYQGALTLTTTGTSGAATLVGNTLNIPQYAAGISGSGTAGQVTYWSGTSAVTGSADLTIDTTIGRVYLNKSYNGTVAYYVTNASTGTSAIASYTATNGTTTISYGVNGTNTTAYGISTANSGYFYSTKNIVFLADNASNGILQFATGGNTEKMRIFTNGNLMLQNGGTFTDGGQRLQVIGSMRVGTTAASAMYWDDTNNRLGIGTSSPSSSLHVVGVGSTNATTALTIQNSSSTTIFGINNAGEVGIGTSSQANFPLWVSSGTVRLTNLVQLGNGSSGTLSVASSDATLILGAAFNVFNKYMVRIGNLTNDRTSSTQGGLLIDHNFAPTSGTGIFHQLGIQPTINQTGGANGITRGIYINPTLTAAADFRAIETTNGKIVFGNLPTSSAGLPTGALWNNLGIVSIV